MQKKSQVVFYSLMLCIVIIILALSLAGPVKETVDNARANTTGDTIGMNCTDSSISTFQTAGCLTADLSLPFFIGCLIFISGVVLTAKILSS